MKLFFDFQLSFRIQAVGSNVKFYAHFLLKFSSNTKFCGVKKGENHLNLQTLFMWILLRTNLHLPTNHCFNDEKKQHEH